MRWGEFFVIPISIMRNIGDSSISTMYPLQSVFSSENDRNALFKRCYEYVATSFYTMRPLQSILPKEYRIAFGEADCPEILLATNVYCIYGASILLYPKYFEQVCEMLQCNSVFIIPSSVHEVLILPKRDTDVINATDLRSMISEVNDTCVEAKDILSYSLYYYERGSNEVVKYED